MKQQKRTGRRAIYWYQWLPWLLLAVSLLTTYWAWRSERALERSEKNNVFIQQFDQTANQLMNQLTLFEQSLYSIRKLFDSSEFVSQDEFNSFGAELIHSKFSSGLYQIGFAKYINLQYPETYHTLDYKLIPLLDVLKTQPQRVYAPIIYLIKHETSALQYPLADAFLNARHKADMQYAALFDETLISNRIKTSPADASECDCLSMLLPVYQHVGKQTKIVDGELNASVDGWVFLNFNLDVVFNNTLGITNNPSIRYALYDGSQAPFRLLYQNEFDGSELSSFSMEKQISLHGKKWVLRAESLPLFEKTLNYKHSTIIGLLGLLASFALTAGLYLVISRLRTLDSLKRINKRLRFSDERWRFAVEGAGDGVWDWDVENKKLSYSKNWKRMFGYAEDCSDEEIEEWRKLVHPDDRSTVLESYKLVFRGGVEQPFECRIKCKNGEWKWVLSRCMVVSKDNKGKPLRIVGTHADLSQLKESEEMVWQHINFDALTDLPNRRMLHSRLEQAMEKAKWKGTKVALICLDLDDFSVVNDTFGPEQGDQLLQQVAKKLVSSVYRYEDVARNSGDEFAILIPDIEASGFSHLDDVAQKLLSVMSEPFLLGDSQVFISCSIGIAVFPDDADSLNDLVRNADQAMYASINKGGNCINYFTSEMQEKVTKRMQLTNDLRLALSKNELFVEYQPIVELKTEYVYKAEALLRWRHPDKGLISPAEFIPIAESTKLINEIGAWVLKEAIAQCAIWRQHINGQFQISVNKSPVQFYDRQLGRADWIQRLADDPQLKHAIVIEITEGLLLDATGEVKARLEAFKQNGIQVALDDFGTGYSSLAYLQKFDIDYLKIDKSFVANLETTLDNRVLCRTIIDMAHNLGMLVIAEGIENKVQKDILLQAGCDYGQGYYFSKSLSPLAFEEFANVNNN
jgi:diguanylate cyclase (GGDEF)-like protein/PAS domain S-box-containing protein